MYTGIVTQRATVSEIGPRSPAGEGAVRIGIALEREIPGLAIGDSVALDGCCLTVVELGTRRAVFEAVPETLRRTTLGARRVGDRLNVEAPLRAGDALGGHFVQGHVDGVGIVEAVSRDGDDVRMTVRLPKALVGATIEKGSVAIDGVSLTVGESDDERFSVYLIPQTLSATGLSAKRVGDAVNLEADVVGRYVEHHVRRALATRRADAAREASS